MKWCRKAAEQGYAKAQYQLGVCYVIGEGVWKNKIEAYAYWSLAMIKDESARKNLARLEKEMYLVERLLGQQRAKSLQKEIEAKEKEIEAKELLKEIEAKMAAKNSGK